MLLDVLLLIIGLVVLYYGAEFLVAGATKIASSFGVSPLIIGLTVVAFATSAPEFIVSLIAAFTGSSDMAIGNIVGSNIANIALIIGVSGLIFPFAVDRSVFKRDFPILVVLSLLMWGMAYTGQRINQLEGLVLLAFLAIFLTSTIREGMAQSREYKQTGAYDAVAAKNKAQGKNVLAVIGGVVGLVVGAQLMVMSASSIATDFGVSELVIGVTIVAFGTSLPELATSVVAAMRKETDISVGNILGSCIFNIAFILGAVPILRPLTVAPEALSFDLPAAVLVVFILGPLIWWKSRISRIDAAVLALFYGTYIGLTIARSLGILSF